MDHISEDHNVDIKRIVLNNNLINLGMSDSHNIGATHELTKWDSDVGL